MEKNLSSVFLFNNLKYIQRFPDKKFFEGIVHEDDLKKEPAEIYNLVLAGDNIEGGRVIGKNERIQIYRDMFEAAFMNASLSHDEMAVIAMLRSSLEITDEEHERAIDLVKKSLEDSVEPKLLDKVKEDLTTVIDMVSGMFDSIIMKR